MSLNVYFGIYPPRSNQISKNEITAWIRFSLSNAKLAAIYKMNEVDEDTDEDVYLFQAPAGNNQAESDETGAIVGAVVACLTITGVLFFLWKVSER